MAKRGRTGTPGSGLRVLYEDVAEKRLPRMLQNASDSNLCRAIGRQLLVSRGVVFET